MRGHWEKQEKNKSRPKDEGQKTFRPAHKDAWKLGVEESGGAFERGIQEELCHLNIKRKLDVANITGLRIIPADRTNQKINNVVLIHGHLKMRSTIPA